MIISLFSSRIKLGSGSEKETITTDFLRIYIDSEREKETIITNFLRIELESKSESNNYQQLSCAYKSTATRPLSTHTGEAVMAPISGLRNMFL